MASQRDYTLWKILSQPLRWTSALEAVHRHSIMLSEGIPTDTHSLDTILTCEAGLRELAALYVAPLQPAVAQGLILTSWAILKHGDS